VRPHKVRYKVRYNKNIIQVGHDTKEG